MEDKTLKPFVSEDEETTEAPAEETPEAAEETPETTEETSE